MNQTEQLILQQCLHNEDVLRRVMPHLKTEYFEDTATREIFGFISGYFDNYNKAPEAKALAVWLEDKRGLTDDEYKQALEGCKAIVQKETMHFDYVIDQTEQWVKDRAIWNALSEAVASYQGEGDTPISGVPNLLEEALAVSFDNSIGHSFKEDIVDVLEYLTTEEVKVATGIEYLDRNLGGGFTTKTLNCFLAPTNVGKTLTMAALASNMLRAGKKVLYVTLEMSSLEIATRIHANLSDKGMNFYTEATASDVEQGLISSLKHADGELIVKEYPTASVNTNVLKALLSELKMKKAWKPDIIFVDYLNLFNSARVGANAGSYSTVKSIAEELRGIAAIHELPIVTATQANRSGFNNSDIDLTNTSESIGLPATVDWMASLYRDEQLDGQGQILVSVQKTRFSSGKGKFVIGVDLDKMRLYDVDDPTRDIINEDDDVPPMLRQRTKFDSSTFDFSTSQF